MQRERLLADEARATAEASLVTLCTYVRHLTTVGHAHPNPFPRLFRSRLSPA